MYHYISCSFIAHTARNTSVVQCAAIDALCPLPTSECFSISKSQLIYCFSLLPFFSCFFCFFCFLSLSIFQDTEQIERFSPALVHYWQQPASTCGSFLHSNYKVGGKDCLLHFTTAKKKKKRCLSVGHETVYLSSPNSIFCLFIVFLSPSHSRILRFIFRCFRIFAQR